MKTLVNFTVTEASEGWAVRYIIPNTPWYPQHGFGTSIIAAMQDATKRDGDEAFTLLMNAWRERYGDAGEGGMVRMRRQVGELFRPPNPACIECDGNGVVQIFRERVTKSLRPWKLCHCLRRIER